MLWHETAWKSHKGILIGLIFPAIPKYVLRGHGRGGGMEKGWRGVRRLRFQCSFPDLFALPAFPDSLVGFINNRKEMIYSSLWQTAVQLYLQILECLRLFWDKTLHLFGGFFCLLFFLPTNLLTWVIRGCSWDLDLEWVKSVDLNTSLIL